MGVAETFGGCQQRVRSPSPFLESDFVQRSVEMSGFVTGAWYPNHHPRKRGGNRHACERFDGRCNRVVRCKDEGVESSSSAGDRASPDLAERLFGFVFGRKESEPLGLKRFDRDRFPEQYPATLDEFADPVESDTEEMTWFRPLLARTQLVSREIQEVYDADRDGWSANAFHDKVNKLGAGVVLVKTKGGAICGGYNPKGWVGYGESRGSLASFLFTWPDGDTSKPAMKLRKIGGKSMSVLDDPDSGPQFGADGLVVKLKSPFQTECDGLEKFASSKLGTFYEVRSDGVRHIFAKSDKRSKTELVWLKAYVGVYAEGEEIPCVHPSSFPPTPIMHCTSVLERERRKNERELLD